MTMKTSDEFKRTIKAYLDERAAADEMFAQSYAKQGKTIDECVNFILNTVKETGCNGFTDAEIYGIAVHYYDEDNLDANYLKGTSGSVVVNHHIELTEEEKQELAEKARKDFYNEQMAKQREAIKPKAVKKEVVVEQGSLF